MFLRHQEAKILTLGNGSLVRHIAYVKAKLYFISDLRGQSLACLRAIAPKYQDTIFVPSCCHPASAFSQLWVRTEAPQESWQWQGAPDSQQLCQPLSSFGAVSLHLEQTLYQIKVCVVILGIWANMSVLFRVHALSSLGWQQEPCVTEKLWKNWVFGIVPAALSVWVYNAL